MITPISVSLSREQKAWLEARKASGEFTNRSAVVQDLLRQAMASESAAAVEVKEAPKEAKESPKSRKASRRRRR